MPITYNATQNRLTVSYAAGDAKGDSLANAYTFDDIYNESVIQGWLVTKEGSQFYIPYSIYITGATFFKCNGVSVNIEGTVDITGFYIYPVGGEIELLNSRFYTITNRKRLNFITNGLILNCIISGFHRHTVRGYDSTLLLKDSVIDWLQIFYQQTLLALEDVRFTRLDNGVAPTGADWSQDRVEFMNGGSSIYWLTTAAEFTVRNLKVKNTTFNTTFYVNTDSTGNLIDCENDPVPHRVVSAALAADRTNIANFQSTFRWLLEQADVDVKIYDASSNLVLDKTVNNADEDVVTFARRTVVKTAGISTATSNVLETFEPFKLVLSKTGYQTTEINDITITRGQPTIIRGSLILIPEPDLPVKITALSITACSAPGEEDGQVVITAAEGTAPYEYSLNGVDYQASNTFADLAAGEYTVYVRDADLTVASIVGIRVQEDGQTFYVTTLISGELTQDSITGTIQAVESISGSVETEDNISGDVSPVEEISGAVISDSIEGDITCPPSTVSYLATEADDVLLTEDSKLIVT